MQCQTMSHTSACVLLDNRRYMSWSDTTLNLLYIVEEDLYILEALKT